MHNRFALFIACILSAHNAQAEDIRWSMAVPVWNVFTGDAKFMATAGPMWYPAELRPVNVAVRPTRPARLPHEVISTTQPIPRPEIKATLGLPLATLGKPE